MENFEELRVKKPRLYRVACELSTYEEPYKVLNALEAILGADVKGRAKTIQALASTAEDGRLLDMICNSKDPGRAFEVATKVIVESLGGVWP